MIKFDKLTEIPYGHFINLDTMTENPIIVDAGCRIGHTSLHLNNMFPNSKIYALECNPNNIDILKKDINIKNFTLIEKALVGDNINDSKLKFRDYGIKIGWGNLYDLYPQRKSTIVEVNTIKMNELMTIVKKIDYFKLDIEYAEVDLFKNISENDLSKINQISLEFHGNNEEIKDIINRLKNLNFETYFYDHGKELFAQNRN